MTKCNFDNCIWKIQDLKLSQCFQCKTILDDGGRVKCFRVMISWWQRLTDLTVGLLNQPTNPTTPYCTVLLHKLPVCQLVMKFPTVYGSRRFIPMFTAAHHFSLSCTTSIQSMPSHPISFRLPSGLFPSGYPIRKGLRHSSMKCCTSVLYMCCITWDDFTHVKTNWRWCLPCNKTICN
jgi:hypothetical protein